MMDAQTAQFTVGLLVAAFLVAVTAIGLAAYAWGYKAALKELGRIPSPDGDAEWTWKRKGEPGMASEIPSEWQEEYQIAERASVGGNPMIALFAREKVRLIERIVELQAQNTQLAERLRKVTEPVTDVEWETHSSKFEIRDDSLVDGCYVGVRVTHRQDARRYQVDALLASRTQSEGI